MNHFGFRPDLNWLRGEIESTVAQLAWVQQKDREAKTIPESGMWFEKRRELTKQLLEQASCIKLKLPH